MNTSPKNAQSGVSKVEPNTQSALLPTYARAETPSSEGTGRADFDDGRRFLDFAAGIAVNVAGHAHPHLVNALTSRPASSGMSRMSIAFRKASGLRSA